MRKFLVIFGVLIALYSCQEAELPLYSEQTAPAINFWVEPAYNGDIVTYPDDLRASVEVETMDAGVLQQRYKAWAPARPMALIETEVGLEIQGYVSGEDRPVAVKFDSLTTPELANATTLPAGIVIPAGKGTVKIPVTIDPNALPVNTPLRLGLVVDFDNSVFVRGLGDRQSFVLTVEIVKEAGTPLPTDVRDFGMFPPPFWDPTAPASSVYDEWENYGYDFMYYAKSLAKFQFIAVVQHNTNLADDTVLPSDGSGWKVFRPALVEYKALNAEDPTTYPPLYNDGTTTWISF